jgi:hypothetical protein
MLEVLELSIAHICVCRSRQRQHHCKGYYYCDTDARHEAHATFVAVHQINPPLGSKTGLPIPLDRLSRWEQTLKSTIKRGWLKMKIWFPQEKYTLIFRKKEVITSGVQGFFSE